MPKNIRGGYNNESNNRTIGQLKIVIGQIQQLWETKPEIKTDRVNWGLVGIFIFSFKLSYFKYNSNITFDHSWNSETCAFQFRWQSMTTPRYLILYSSLSNRPFKTKLV